MKFKKNKYLIFLIVCFSIVSCERQPVSNDSNALLMFTLSNEDQDPVYHARATVSDQSVLSDSSGRVELQLQHGPAVLHVTAPGYEEKSDTTNLQTGQNDLGRLTLRSLNSLRLDIMKNAENLRTAFQYCGFLIPESNQQTDGFAEAHLKKLSLMHNERIRVTVNELYQECLLYRLKTRRQTVIEKTEFLEILGAAFYAAEQHPSAPQSLFFFFLLLDENGDLKSAQSFNSSTHFTAPQAVMLLSALYILAQSPQGIPSHAFVSGTGGSGWPELIDQNWMILPVDAGISSDQFNTVLTDPAPGLATLGLALELSFGLFTAENELKAQYMPFAVSGSLQQGNGIGNLAAAILYKIQTGRLGQSLSSNELQGLYLSENGEFTAETGALNITYPRASDVWVLGDSAEITWETGMLGGTVSLELYRSGERVREIDSSTENDGRYTGWMVPLNLQPAPSYRVRIMHHESKDYDYSEPFTILPARDEIEITEPNTSTVWIQGQKNVPIRWNTRFNDGSVSIFLVRDESFQTLAAETPNDGEYYDFNVPDDQFPSMYSISIQHLSKPDVRDNSPDFEIKPSNVADIRIIQPDEFSIWKTGSTVELLWEYTGLKDDSVRIDLYDNGQWIHSIAETAAARAVLDWRIPDDVAEGDAYQIRISSLDGTLSRLSADFTILQIGSGCIHVIRPVSETVWIPGRSVDFITWTANGDVGSRVKISLLKNSAAVLDAFEAENTGSFLYAVPQSLGFGRDYQIKVESNNRTISGMSSPFTVIPPERGFWETFDSGAANWSPDSSEALWNVENGAYVCRAHPLSAVSLYPKPFSGDFVYEGEVEFTSNAAGLTVFRNPENSRGYAFLINKDAQFSFIRFDAGNQQVDLVNHLQFPDFNLQERHIVSLRIEYDASEKLFSFYADSQWLFYARDDRYTSGSFGVISQWCDGSDYSRFDDLKLYLP